MGQNASNNYAHFDTYNDVAGNQTNNYTVITESVSSNQDQADMATIRSLQIAKDPSGNQHQTCAYNTRVQILQDIRTWAEDTTTTNQIFWLADRAGTGKSTVAKQIAKDWERAAKPVASFFFSINAADTRSNAKFCPTIATKLAGRHDFGSFRSKLAEALRQQLAVETLDFNDQFTELLLAPLKKTNKPVLIVIDALDECDKRDRSELLSVLLDKLIELPMVKVMITSRPEPDIAELLQRGDLIYSSDLRGSSDVDSSTQDVLQYVSHFFANSPKLRRVQSYAPILARKAKGLFIYASTACQYLKESLDVDSALETIGSINGLDNLYSQIMERAIPKNDAVSLQAVTLILQTILAAQRPLSISEMQKLLKKDWVVRSVVETLGSVLSSGVEDGPVEILHPTFQEYLTKKERSGAYFVDVKKGHKSIAIGCLEALGEKTATFPNPILENITSTLEYATIYWTTHAAAFLWVANAHEDILLLEDRILSFFKKNLIYWFELIVLLKAVYRCARDLATLEASTASDPTNMTYERKHWCRDSQRFLQHHQPVIEQEYKRVRGALAFTPRESVIYKAYFARFAQEIPAVLCGIPMEWPSHRTLSGHTSEVTSVAFSPDGTRVVSGSHDCTLRLWDGATGASIGGPMKGHTRSVTSVAFSPDGTRVVSGSGDDTLRLWDVRSYTQMVVINAGFIAHKLKLSACGTYILSNDRIWDIRVLLPSPVTGIDPALSTQFSSPVRYDNESRLIEVHTSSVFTYPVSGCDVNEWIAQGGRIALGLVDGRVVIIDCTHLL